MKKLSNEVKVGILVFAALVLLTILIFGVGEVRIFQRGYRYHVVFDGTAGLNVGAQVRMGGVKVGSVENIDFVEYKGKRRVRVTVLVRKDLTLHQKDRFNITMMGLLGDNYVEIEPGPSQAKVIPPNEDDVLIEGAEVIGMTEMIRSVRENLRSLREALDEETIARFKNTVSNAERSSAELAQILETSGGDITVTLANLRSSSERLDRMLARNETSLSATMDNLALMSDDFRATATNLREISEGLQDGKGSAGKFLKDEKLYDDLLTTTGEAQELIKDIRERPGRYLHLSIF